MSDDHTTAPAPEALAAVFRAAGWHYTPDLDTFTYFERKTWLAAASALDAFAKAAVERERERCASIIKEGSKYTGGSRATFGELKRRIRSRERP
jgi:hypothetical protein